MQSLVFVFLGLVVGAFSGLVGVGGGVVLIPAFVFFFGMSQHLAQGTSLAVLVPPIGILAAWTYYKQGYVDVRIAALVCAGFLIGSFFGAKIATELPQLVLRRVFGTALALVGLKMALGK